MSDVIPMPSARMGPGRYAVLGTSQFVECFLRRRKWWLAVGAETELGPFQTKREALQYCQEHSEL